MSVSFSSSLRGLSDESLAKSTCNVPLTNAILCTYRIKSHWNHNHSHRFAKERAQQHDDNIFTYRFCAVWAAQSRQDLRQLKSVNKSAKAGRGMDNDYTATVRGERYRVPFAQCSYRLENGYLWRPSRIQREGSSQSTHLAVSSVWMLNKMINLIHWLQKGCRRLRVMR